MSRILVTGALGTIGSRLVPELRRRGHWVVGCDLRHTTDQTCLRCDVADYRQLSRLCEDVGTIDYIYHLAAEFGRVNGEEYYEQLWRTNVLGTRNILELQRDKRFRLIFASSSEVYGDWLPDGLIHESATQRQPLRHLNDYAITKWVNEQQIVNFAERYGTETMRLRFFNAYGPGEDYHPYRSVVCLFCYRALHGLPYTVYEDYHRVFMYIADFIPTLSTACEQFAAGRAINIGGDEYRSVRELSDLILACAGRDDSGVTYLPREAHNVANKRPDIRAAQDVLGHNPRVELEEGVPATIAWMRERYGIPCCV